MSKRVHRNSLTRFFVLTKETMYGKNWPITGLETKNFFISVVKDFMQQPTYSQPIKKSRSHNRSYSFQTVLSDNFSEGKFLMFTSKSVFTRDRNLENSSFFYWALPLATHSTQNIKTFLTIFFVPKLLKWWRKIVSLLKIFKNSSLGAISLRNGFFD